MVTLILTMILGIIFGRIIRKNKKAGIFSKSIFPIVLVLLFFMGISIGNNKLIMDNLSTLGWEALIITLGALTGTLIGAFCIWKYFFKSKEVTR
ncbi:MAG: LysO family transporter [Bacteroidales bacterium]|nr:LysO family transporter [Bacteroidales bacterium]